MSTADKQALTIIVDRASVECFTDIAAASNLVFPAEGYNHIELFTSGGSVVATSAEIARGAR